MSLLFSTLLEPAGRDARASPSSTIVAGEAVRRGDRHVTGARAGDQAPERHPDRRPQDRGHPRRGARGPRRPRDRDQREPAAERAPASRRRRRSSSRRAPRSTAPSSWSRSSTASSGTTTAGRLRRADAGGRRFRRSPGRLRVNEVNAPPGGTLNLPGTSRRSVTVLAPVEDDGHVTGLVDGEPRSRPRDDLQPRPGRVGGERDRVPERRHRRGHADVGLELVLSDRRGRSGRSTRSNCGPGWSAPEDTWPTVFFPRRTVSVTRAGL